MDGIQAVFYPAKPTQRPTDRINGRIKMNTDIFINAMFYDLGLLLTALCVLAHDKQYSPMVNLIAALILAVGIYFR